MKKQSQTPVPKNKVLWVLLPMVGVITLGFLLSLFIVHDFKKDDLWAGIRPEVKEVVLQMQDYGELTNQSIGYEAKPSPQWSRQGWFIKNAQQSEMIQLTNHPSALVKAIAYEGLVRRGYLDYPLLLKALKDTSAVFSYQEGCLGSEKMLGEYLLSDVMHITDNSVLNLPKMKQKYNFKPEELSHIENIYQKRLARTWGF